MSHAAGSADFPSQARSSAGIVSEARLALARVRAGLDPLGSAFVEDMRKQTDVILSCPMLWRQRVAGVAQQPLQRYVIEVERRVRAALGPLDLPAARFQLDLRGLGDLAPVQDRSALWGALCGLLIGGWVDGGCLSAALGASVGAWMSKQIFGIDAKLQTKKKTAGFARAAKPLLRLAAQHHLAALDQMLSSLEQPSVQPHAIPATPCLPPIADVATHRRRPLRHRSRAYARRQPRCIYSSLHGLAGPVLWAETRSGDRHAVSAARQQRADTPNGCELAHTGELRSPLRMAFTSTRSAGPAGVSAIQ